MFDVIMGLFSSIRKDRMREACEQVASEVVKYSEMHSAGTISSNVFYSLVLTSVSVLNLEQDESELSLAIFNAAVSASISSGDDRA